MGTKILLLWVDRIRGFQQRICCFTDLLPIRKITQLNRPIGHIFQTVIRKPCKIVKNAVLVQKQRKRRTQIAAVSASVLGISTIRNGTLIMKMICQSGPKVASRSCIETKYVCFTVQLKLLKTMVTHNLTSKFSAIQMDLYIHTQDLEVMPRDFTIMSLTAATKREYK